ncbi:hypothetical protein E2562_026947 [Oryza meyeriana var. granulata]|uniref:BZIP domain-containing protein n=1 Tax=Oryza meyeriana var. granulata TaxID=110450 RepID=A0A6G1BQ63_9ORYZ|nr:hypothetical protein E2562_026947 [Oryza meyeriana var. granulata]
MRCRGSLPTGKAIGVEDLTGAQSRGTSPSGGMGIQERECRGWGRKVRGRGGSTSSAEDSATVDGQSGGIMPSNSSDQSDRSDKPMDQKVLCRLAQNREAARKSWLRKKLLVNQLEPLTEQQLLGLSNLQQSSQQAEDALSQGMEELQLLGRYAGWVPWSIRIFRERGILHGPNGYGHGQNWDP